jgi:hypothetical protein
LQRSVVYTQDVVFLVGTWLSLVEHSLGVRGVGSSNLPVPTIKINHLQDYPACIRLAVVGSEQSRRAEAPIGRSRLNRLVAGETV